jgi:hypothetical protein
MKNTQSLKAYIQEIEKEEKLTHGNPKINWANMRTINSSKFMFLRNWSALANWIDALLNPRWLKKSGNIRTQNIVKATNELINIKVTGINTANMTLWGRIQQLNDIYIRYCVINLNAELQLIIPEKESSIRKPDSQANYERKTKRQR